MIKQQTFASAAWSRKGKVTRRERFLAEMDAVIPWSRLLGLIEPHYPNSGKGRPPHDLERMLRIYFLQQILRFRHRLEKHRLTEAIFEAVKDLLAEHRLTLRAGTIVDATIIAAPSSTKNATGTRDPEMKQTRKGKNWHFGMKLHIGTDRRGIVHSLTATHAAESDIKQLPHLLHGEESELYGDQAYWKEADRQAFEEQGVRYRVNRRAPGGNRHLSERWRKINRARSRTRACCEHPFRVIKQLWGFQKTRYRGIAKNLARAQTMFALANLYALRHRLLPPGERCAL